MPAPLKHPTVAMIGLAVIALLCLQLLRDAITLETAALRALLTVVVLVAFDRIAVPIGRAMVSSQPRRADPKAGQSDASDDEGWSS